MVWQETTLGTLLRIKHGFAFRGEFFRDTGPAILLTPGNFKAEGGLKLKGDKEKYYVGPIPDEFVLAEGDMIVAMTDLTQNAPILGSAAIVPESGRFLHNQRLGKVVDVNSRLATREFVYYLFNSEAVRAQIRATATGATVRHTAPERIYSVRVALPPLPVQRRIASILSAYDDLIENCERRIRVLDEMARSLYREWFMNYRYPGHESVPLVDSPMGRIPKGWEVTSASTALEINPRVKVPRTGELPFVPMGSLSNDSMVISDIETRDRPSGSKFQNNDTLFARITPCLENGKTGFVQFLPDDESAACGSTEFIVLRGRSVPPQFVYCLARSPEFRDHAIKSMTGATGRQRVQEACFDRYFLAQPPAALLERFEEITKPMFTLVQTLHTRVANLRQTRDLLLPRLLSGQLSVEEVE